MFPLLLGGLILVLELGLRLRQASPSVDADRQSLKVNGSLTLASIPPATLEYRLGSRSAICARSCGASLVCAWAVNRPNAKPSPAVTTATPATMGVLTMQQFYSERAAIAFGVER